MVLCKNAVRLVVKRERKSVRLLFITMPNKHANDASIPQCTYHNHCNKKQRYAQVSSNIVMHFATSYIYFSFFPHISLSFHSFLNLDRARQHHIYAKQAHTLNQGKQRKVWYVELCSNIVGLFFNTTKVLSSIFCPPIFPTFPIFLKM